MDIPLPLPASAAFGTGDDPAASIERRIARTEVRQAPFTHIVVDDLLPEAVRRGLDQHWPDRRRMRESNYAQRGEMRASRLAEATDGPPRTFWLELRALTARISRAVRQRLEPHLGEKFHPMLGPDWRATLGRVGYEKHDAMLAHYTGEVDLPPHVDHARLVVNGFCYLGDGAGPTTPGMRGTMLYRSLGFAWPTNRDIPPVLRRMFLREATEVEWRDNRLLAYVNGPFSFHGVPPHDLGDARRRLLMFGSLFDGETTRRVLDEALL